MNYLIAFLLSFTIALIATPLVRALAFRWGAIDRPDNARKFHLAPTPRLGGLAIAVAFFITLALNVELTRPVIALISAAMILLTVGAIDDIRQLGPWHKLFWQVVAAIVVLGGGIGIVFLTNPLGGVIALDFWRIPVALFGLEFNILPVANLVSIVWIVGIINAINFHDGLDGLAGGVVAIAALVMFIFAIGPIASDPLVAILSVILLGSVLGFLPYNFFPSSIFLGDSGAYLAGLLLATLAIFGSSKIAIGAVVLGFAILDALLTVLRRLWRKQSPFKADRKHLHYLLHDNVFTHRQTVVAIYAITVLLAVAVLLFDAVVAFSLAVLLMVVVFIYVKLIITKQPPVGGI